MPEEENFEDILSEWALTFEAWDELGERSNAELAELLMMHVIIDTNISSPFFALYSAIYDRLRLEVTA